ncbi:MAG: hypothetical protein GY820_41595 [Gammaproteobacteria bacterium]|nr:hypothetical protein [Gammaproteobacteria bacterium]
MLKVYCDTGGYRKELKALVANGKIELYQFQYENRNRHIANIAEPSKPTYQEMNYTYAELDGITYADLSKQSDKFGEITTLIGSRSERDIKHLDSAFQTKCEIFVTSDKGDICSKKAEIFGLLGIRVIHFQDDWDQLIELCANGS